MKRIALALAAVAAIAAPVVMNVASAGAAPDNSTLNCTNFGDSNRCTATDPDVLHYIRVVDPVTGQEIKSVSFACSDNITKRGFNFPDTGGDHYRILVADCTNSTDKYSITIPQAV